MRKDVKYWSACIFGQNSIRSSQQPIFLHTIINVIDEQFCLLREYRKCHFRGTHSLIGCLRHRG